MKQFYETLIGGGRDESNVLFRRVQEDIPLTAYPRIAFRTAVDLSAFSTHFGDATKCVAMLL